MMKLTFAVFALIAMTNGIHLDEDNLEDNLLPETESMKNDPEMKESFFNGMLAASRSMAAEPVQRVMDKMSPSQQKKIKDAAA